ncbi:MAG: S8 family serine peptidase, partial [Planctomycetota bacterium]
HVAGISAAETDNGIGVAGVSGGSTILPLQFYNYGANPWTADVIAETFIYATDNGANIVNTSYNMDGWANDPIMTLGYEYMVNNNVLHFNSAGNGNSYNTARQVFDQTLFVVSTTADDTRSGFSNYGEGVDISSPGSGILSHRVGNGYGFSSGTSMAAPDAAGVAALIWSHNPGWTNTQVAAQLLATADNIDHLNPGFEGWLGAGRTNAYQALTRDLSSPKLRYIDTLPDDGGSTNDLTIDSFAIAFDQVMSLDSANDHSNYQLVEAGADDRFGTGDDSVISITPEIYKLGTNRFEVALNDGALGYGHYQLTLSGNLESAFNEKLDGNSDGIGGDSYIHEFWIREATEGIVSLDQTSYLDVSVLGISLVDNNLGTSSVDVTITTSSGDSEQVTLTDNGSGSWTSTIDALPGDTNVGDGVLNSVVGDTITVTYDDADDGLGNSSFSIATASFTTYGKFNSADVPVTIGAGDTVSSTIDISNSGTILDMDVSLNLDSLDTSNLKIVLTAPNGTQVELFSNRGQSGEPNLRNTNFNDEAVLPIHMGEAPFTGGFQPEENLANFDCFEISGTWTLTIENTGAVDATLHSWCVVAELGETQHTPSTLVPVGNLRSGVAVEDSAFGAGYLMFSPESVHTRFSSAFTENSDHIIAVRHNGSSWQYSTNVDWINFAPRFGDRLLASVDFDADTVSSLQGSDGITEGIATGYFDGDLEFVANQFNGMNDSGEFEVTGTQFSAVTPIFIPDDGGQGVAVSDDATGTGFIMFSEEVVHERFTSDRPNANNSDHLLAVQFDSGVWYYNNNSEWIPFIPEDTDRLIADVNFDTDAINLITCLREDVNGMETGIVNGDLVFAANQFNGDRNPGEFDVSGSFFSIPYTAPVDALKPVSLGDLRWGIGIDDDATGGGFLMYTAESVHDRFGDVDPQNSDHLIAVRFEDGDWQYNTNYEWIDFEPVSTDNLLASIDFDQDTAVTFEESTGVHRGISLGFIESDMALEFDVWNGGFDGHELTVTGTFFTAKFATDIGALNDGVAGDDAATGDGFLMYSAANVHERWGTFLEGHSDHLVTVRYQGSGWEFNNNTVWQSFEPAIDDRILADINFGTGDIQSRQGTNGVIHGLQYGYETGDLRYIPNRWAGSGNSGEYTVTGTYFDGLTSEAVGEFNSGVASADDAVGQGYLLYSRVNVHDRFAGSALPSTNNDHFVVVRNNGQGWQFNDDRQWASFNPLAGDRIVAEINFTTDVIQGLDEDTTVFDGIDLGFIDSDLTFFANRWNGRGNTGEFEVSGTYFAS